MKGGRLHNLRELRESQGWSQAELAVRLNTSQQQIYKLENGTRPITKFWAVKLGAAFEVDPAGFVFQTGVTVIGEVCDDGFKRSERFWELQGIRSAPGGTSCLIVATASLYPFAAVGDGVVFDEECGLSVDELMGEIVVCGWQSEIRLQRLLRRNVGKSG